MSDFSEQTGLRPYRYEQPPYGEFGRLEEFNGRLVCHICGRLYRGLNVHVLQAHGMPVTEYRATFGLNKTVGLVSSGLSRVMAANARRAPQTKRMRDTGLPPADRALAGAKSPRSLQWRLEQSERQAGRAISQEQREKQSKTMLGRSELLAERTRQQWKQRSPEERRRVGQLRAAGRARMTVCREGHEVTGENRTSDHRCRICRNKRVMENYMANHEARLERRRDRYRAKKRR